MRNSCSQAKAGSRSSLKLASLLWPASFTMPKRRGWRMLLETNRFSLKPSHQNQEISIRSIFLISLALTCNALWQQHDSWFSADISEDVFLYTRESSLRLKEWPPASVPACCYTKFISISSFVSYHLIAQHVDFFWYRACAPGIYIMELQKKVHKCKQLEYWRVEIVTQSYRSGFFPNT